MESLLIIFYSFLKNFPIVYFGKYGKNLITHILNSTNWPV